MAEEDIRKIMRVGTWESITLRGKTGRAGFSGRFLGWVGNTLRYVFNQTGLSSEEAAETERAIAEHLERRKK